MNSDRTEPDVKRESKKLDDLQARIGHFFRDVSLLKQALTHSSASEEEGRGRLGSNERLEFLGDSVINLIFAEMLFDLFPHEDEGILTKLRSWWISGKALAESSRSLFIPECLRMGRGERASGGAEKERIQACALEALFGALYLDGGMKTAKKPALALWKDAVRERGMDVLLIDAKTRLQEFRQAKGLHLPSYETVASEEGFSSVVFMDGEAAGRGSGNSRKAAEQEAARDAFSRLPEIELKKPGV